MLNPQLIMSNKKETTKLSKEERLANDYANNLYPDFSEYHAWKEIKEAYLAGFEGHRKMISDSTKDIIACMD